jgi:predicted Fe-Mo cluster-binding NifX family protein
VNDDKKVTGKEIVPSPQGCGCKSNIASVLRDMGVTVMLAGNMGGGAFNVLNYNGIQVFRGCAGNVENVVNDYLNGSIVDSNVSCSSHGHHGTDGHQCNH